MKIVGDCGHLRDTRAKRCQMCWFEQRKARAAARFAERFWSKVDKHGPIPAHNPALGRCWVWTAGLDRRGYGAFGRTVAGRWVNNKAHRVAYEIEHGEIPESLMICHHCDNPVCVRASHIYAGTDADNTRDRIERGRLGGPRRKNEPAQFRKAKR